MNARLDSRKDGIMLSTEILIVGTGCSGLMAALKLPADKKIIMITKSDVESCDSYLAQGGICMLKDPGDYDSYMEDTLRAGHYENDRESVDIMIRSSQDLIQTLVNCGVDFQRKPNGEFEFTREGAHSHKRILFHEDETGKEITKKLLEKVRTLPNVMILENTTMLDIVEENNVCYGAVIKTSDGRIGTIEADHTILATGGVGGLYEHSTNYHHLTGDGVAIAIKHNIKLRDVNYVQIHPTTLYTENEEERSFLISESVRGEGAKLYGADMKRFTNELLPRDLLSQKIHEQMKKDGTNHVWEDLRTIPYEERHRHFPNIIEACLKHGYNPDEEPIPVVPAQHYYMGGIWVNHESHTSMHRLYAVGETACNGVHGKNRLASNSLLESMVFAVRAADVIRKNTDTVPDNTHAFATIDTHSYEDEAALKAHYADLVRTAIENANMKQAQEEASTPIPDVVQCTAGQDRVAASAR